MTPSITRSPSTSGPSGGLPRRFTTGAGMTLVLVVVGCALGGGPREARADEAAVIKLTIHPSRIDGAAAYPRLLPEDPDLRPGNAAVVLLRMPWLEWTWIQEWLPKLAEIAQLPPDDPRVAEVPFDSFAGAMRRAAFIRDADWAYPLADEPLASIPLPDVQGLIDFIGRGMPIWVNQRIAAGDLDAAREGILTMLACSRHVARNPLFVCNMMATTTAGAALDRVEALVSRPGCPNMHAPLAFLPDSIGDCQAAIQTEARMIERSLAGLRDDFPSSGDAEGWRAVIEEYLLLFDEEGDGGGKRIDPAERRRVLADRAARAALADGAVTATEPPVSGDELAMRQILAEHADAHRRAEAAWLLPAPEAIRSLAALDRSASVESLLDSRPWEFLRVYLTTKGFGRRARMLEVVEALRDAAARNGGRFPPSLAEVPARVPLDPFTGKQFVYEPAADGRSARLATPPIPGVDDPRSGRIYELTLADPE